MNDHLDSIKTQWQSLNAPFSGRGKVYASEILKRRNLGRVGSNPVRIAGVYRRLTVVSGVWIVLSLLMARSLFPMWLSCLMASYFAVMGAMCYSVRESALEIDFSSMSVVRALEAVYGLQRKLLRQRVVGLMIMFPVLMILFYYFSGVSVEMVWGGVAGAVIGLCIGLSLDRRVRRQIKEMKQALEDAMGDCVSPSV